jgi:hypothetical protein
MQSFGAAQYPLLQPMQAARQKIQEFKLDINHNLLKEIINNLENTHEYHTFLLPSHRHSDIQVP